MSKGLENRERNFENKFAHEEEFKFKIASRRRKLLGLWAADLMRLNDEEGLKYALFIINYGIEDTSAGAVVNRILADLTKKEINITENEIRQKNAEFEEIAKKQLMVA